ncbi:MAG: putative diguanylate cyclase YdaM [Pelotomaculum sp. PtaB.Bin013]|uniref:Diguanylate cyclase n=1 Tax=Pelotomaculum isophthalicicum JI TaxID=947010 RepID=A0A9X4JWN6_9FIRM|nr:diguanylate cyclase [Pelotomaculum isophthalicicum]MDF9409538.1 diguanylate cyclase [Pelotomaculum isophthalicicum JI]OPX87819.1 MAG: putative diguanylate cyclase YdaM [Pelotomaculum sp. PtaB.Bin013]
MITRILVIRTLDVLKGLVNTGKIKTLAKNASAIFIQVFTSKANPQWVKNIETILHENLPGAIIVGASTSGEIANGQLFTNSTVISITFFKETTVKAFILDAATGGEVDLGKTLRADIENTCAKIAGVLLLTTTTTMDVSDFLTGFADAQVAYPVFGGGAGEYSSPVSEMKALIFCNSRHTFKGVVAVAFLGDGIKIETHNYLGWHPLGKEMVITEVNGYWVKKIDGQPAFKIYRRYLDIQNDKSFQHNAIVFPLMVKRDGRQYARPAMAVNEENAILFLADLKKGETVLFGYGDPNTIIEQAAAVQSLLAAFEPESIFLYSCAARRAFLHNDVELETKPFENIAPTSGFYTHGEINSSPNSINHLNYTMVAVGMKERNYGGKAAQIQNGHRKPLFQEDADLFAYQHSRFISRLLHFIRAVTDELEIANKETRRLAETDLLTQAYNRVKACELLNSEKNRCERYGSEFSIIILDIDFFKEVNDTYRHIAGDAFLVNIVKIIKKQVRAPDMLSRWGGEEFLIAMPETGLDGALVVAEKIRAAVEQTVFPGAGHQTCSLGVTSFKKGERIEELIERADAALYEAKQSGRNRVIAK